MTGLVSRGHGRIGLHYEIARRAGHAVLIRTVVDHRRDAAEIVVRRGRGRDPFESCRFPRIVAGLLTFLHAPEEVENENKLTGDGDKGCEADEFLDRSQLMNPCDFSALRIAAQAT